MSFTDHLELVGPDRSDDGDVVAVVLVHDEANLLPAFLDHYARLGSVAFVVVDDRSTDGSGEMLAARPDVTLLRPRSGSTYRAHKREWRGQVLDRVSRGRWTLSPDADELLVWHGAPSRTFADMVATLEAEGADALYAVMADCYRDAPLAGHVHDGGDPRAAFPLCDDPWRSGGTTWTELAPRRTRAAWPAPAMAVLGGMRHRLFGAGRAGPLRRLRTGLHDHRPGPAGLRLEAALRPFVKQRRVREPAINLTKLPLVRWRTGMRFLGGAHALDRPLRLASERAVLLHFPVTRGMDGIRHVVARGQHAGGSAHYRAMEAAGAANPSFAGSMRYDAPGALGTLTAAPDGTVREAVRR